jgi:DNA-directed RNA polymerase subunit beta'
VLLNRAPTLHRLGIQAFEPLLIEGKAIQIHPLVCTAFNADFDGDQMAVHLPLSAEAQAEARVLMLSANNMLSPANGKPLVTPTPDMIIGAFYLTEDADGEPGEGRVFRRMDQVERALEAGEIGLHAQIVYRGAEYPDLVATPANGSAATYHTTTAGRLLFNRALPDGYEYVNQPVRKKEMARSSTVSRSSSTRPSRQGARRDQEPLLPLRHAVGPHDLDQRRVTPANKYDILDRHEMRPTRSRSSSAAASSPTVSASRRRSRSGRPRPPR